MIRWTVILAASLTAVLAACSSVPTGAEMVTQGSQALSSAPLCCVTLATAKRIPLPVEPAEVVIDPSAQAFDFGGNKAFFVLYELPQFKETYSVVLSSSAGGTLQDAALFIPRVATYDANYKVLRFFDEKTLRNRGNNLERTVFFNPEDGSERYLAIYGSDLSASIERAYSMATITPVTVGVVTFMVHSGHDGKSTLRSAPTGRLRVEVQGLAPPRK